MCTARTCSGNRRKFGSLPNSSCSIGSSMTQWTRAFASDESPRRTESCGRTRQACARTRRVSDCICQCSSCSPRRLGVAFSPVSAAVRPVFCNLYRSFRLVNVCVLLGWSDIRPKKKNYGLGYGTGSGHIPKSNFESYSELLKITREKSFLLFTFYCIFLHFCVSLFISSLFL